MAASVQTPSPAHQNKGGGISSMAAAFSSSPSFSPSSDKRFWSALRSRVDVLLEERSSKIPNTRNELDPDPNLCVQMNVGGSERAKRLKEDSMLLLRGFDSVSQTLSQLSNNLDNALQSVKDLAKPPTLTEILHASLKNSESKDEDSKQHIEEGNAKKGQKRKYEADVSSGEEAEDCPKEKERLKGNEVMRRAKNIGLSMATKAAALARELKSIKSDLGFMQERCALLEEENRRLRDGFAKGVRPEEDDLVRLQLEALLAEKSRLANENANLVRENQCLHQLVEYHQITSQDLSASYEQVIQGLCLDFSSPLPKTEEDVKEQEGEDTLAAQTPQTSIFDFSRILDESFEEEHH